MSGLKSVKWTSLDGPMTKVLEKKHICPYVVEENCPGLGFDWGM